MRQFRIHDTAITNRDKDSFQKYLLEVKAIPVLTADEEYEIAMLAQADDVKSRELLVKHNLRFVISVAKQYVAKELKLEDLVNEGNCGLITASHRFDPTRGFKFISYAVWWIRRSILAFIADHGRLIRIPNNKNNIMHKLKLRYDVLENKLERKPNYSELCEELNGDFDKGEVSFYLDMMASSLVSLDTPVDSDGSLTPYSDLLSDDDDNSTDHLLKNDDSNYNLNRLLGALKNDNEREVLTLLYGLNGDDELKLKSVGLIMNLTGERVRQIRDKALLRLRNVLR